MYTLCFWNGEPKVKGESKLVTLLLLNYCKTKGKADQINSSICFGLRYSKGKKKTFCTNAGLVECPKLKVKADNRLTVHC